MYILKISQLVLGIMLICSMPLLATEEIIIVSQSTSASGGKTFTKIYISNEILLMENSGQDNSTFIYNSSKEIFTYIDNKKKEYYELDKQTLTTLKSQLSMFLVMMKQFSSQMPAEQKKKLEPFLNPGSQPKISYTKAGTETIEKWKTTKFVGTADGEDVIKMNIVSYDAIGYSKSSFAVLESMTSFMIDNLKELLPLLPYKGSTSMIGLDENSPVLKNGIPVRTSSFEGNTLTNENIVTSIDKISIDESKFSIPAGYKKKVIDLQNQLSR